MKKTVLSVAAVAVLGFAGMTVWAGGGHGGDHHHGKDHGKGHDGGHHAIGMPGQPEKVDRTVHVEMDDNMRFSPSRIEARPGETLRIVVRNKGAQRHELVLGAREELKEHAEMMRRNPGMKHDDPGAVSAGPGEQGELVWKLPEGGTVEFACLMPGHFEAGMRGRIVVAGGD